MRYNRLRRAVANALKVVMVEPYQTGRPIGKNITKPSRSSRHLCRCGPIPSACVACWPRPSQHINALWARPGLARWIRANVDSLLATIERLYAMALGGDLPGSAEFLERMALLPALVDEIERGAPLNA